MRQADLDRRLGLRTRVLARLCARLSRNVPARIVYNARAASAVHAAAGWDDSRAVVIPNGFDTAAFRPHGDERATARLEFGLGRGVPLVGIVARFHPQKDLANFVDAASLVLAVRPEVRFVLCGRGVDASNERGMQTAAGVDAAASLIG